MRDIEGASEVERLAVSLQSVDPGGALNGGVGVDWIENRVHIEGPHEVRGQQHYKLEHFNYYN